MSKLGPITRIERDFTEQNAPFDGATLPEKDALEQVDDGDELAFLSYGVSLDYNRSADQLWSNCLELYEHDTDFFDPETVVDIDDDELRSVFTGVGFRYGNRDADGWMKNSGILVDEFDGSWWQLLDRADFDAVRLMRVLEDYDLQFLKGDKLAPFYAKVVDANVTGLERVWELPIPVDVHIRRLTQDIAGDDLSDDDIRDFWKESGSEHDIEPMVVDTALWIIGNQWDNFGEDYWERVVR